jgi:hypothetical protein
MEGQDIDWNLEHLVPGVEHQSQVDAIVALDDYDVEKSNLSKRILELMVWDKLRDAILRDKLAMRMRRRVGGINSPSFCSYLTIMTSILSLTTFHGF